MSNTRSGEPHAPDQSVFSNRSTGGGQSISPHRTPRTGMLDELFTLAGQYRTGRDFAELLAFVARFREYAPFNAMLVNVQMRGARFVAPASRWWKDWGRRITPGSRPLIILQPMGPVMFVFDVSQTEATDKSPPLPREVLAPFAASGADPQVQLRQTIENATHDGVRVLPERAGSQRSGSIRTASDAGIFRVLVRRRPYEEWADVPVRYELFYNDNHDTRSLYATLVHELAHLYLGHLGTPNDRWWPDRRGLTHEHEEFEAESVAWMVCKRLGVNPHSERYLGDYLGKAGDIPPISVDLVMKVAGDIEEMGKRRLPLRKEKKK